MVSAPVDAEPVVVVCRRCRTPLTLALHQAAASALRRTGAAPSLPTGTLVVDPNPVYRNGSSVDDHATTVHTTVVDAGSFVVNPTDVIASSTREIGSTRGCCGLNGSDGDNQACAACGLVIGRLWTECWTQHEMRFHPRSVDTTPVHQP